MDERIRGLICEAAACHRCEPGVVIQSLWSGYGVIQKVELVGQKKVAAVVKFVDLSEARANRRGWDGDVSHQRKVKSYAVENEFYDRYSPQCFKSARVPKLLGTKELKDGAGWLIVLEDLDASGFSVRKRSPSLLGIKGCLAWLARFHATFMGCDGVGLWPTGTYWHLKTRPHELAEMKDGPLKANAKAIDEQLSRCQFQTLVHGDAKIANFCFADQENAEQPVAAVDFQYVGRGCGMKDVVYFLTSCLSDGQCDREYQRLLGFYFDCLQEALGAKFERFDDLESEWRSMFAMAWADFNRFLNGWSPGHWKLTPFSQRMTDEALEML